MSQSRHGVVLLCNFPGSFCFKMHVKDIQQPQAVGQNGCMGMVTDHGCRPWRCATVPSSGEVPHKRLHVPSCSHHG